MMCSRHSCVWPISSFVGFLFYIKTSFYLSISVEFSDCLGPLGLVFLQYNWRSRKDAIILFVEQDDQSFIASVELLNLDRDADN